MPIIIDGEKYYVRELEGTDVHAVHKFLNEVKGKAALMLYVDAEGEINGQGVYKTKKALTQLEEHIGLKLS